MRITGKGFGDGGMSFDKFIVTGKLYGTNIRFRKIYNGTVEGYYTAMGINLYNGSVWGQTEEGKRKLIKRIIN